MENIAAQLTSVFEFQDFYHRTTQLIRVVVVCEDPDPVALQAILAHGTLLYVFNQSPYYKHTYASPDPARVQWYASERLLKYFDIDEAYLQSHVPSPLQLLKAERIVVSNYRSPDHLEVSAGGRADVQCIFSKTDVENTSISIIATTILELFEDFEIELSGLMQQIKQVHALASSHRQIDYLSHVLLLFPQNESAGSVFSPVASFVAENGIVGSNQLSGISDALCSSIDMKTASFFLPFTHLKPYLFDMLTSIFLPKSYSAPSSRR